ncbi:MAG TPA: ABC transporter permease [Candidatus Kapabacteria bacterium]|nr:ABC transporter permease [Candidatus Kapabacteria bacterium]
MGFEYFLARRYAFSKKRENFITIISVLSMLGITVGTAALITVLSVFNGFSTLVTDLLLVFDPHVRITASQNATDEDGQSLRGVLPDYQQVVKDVSFLNDAKMITPLVQGKCVLVHYTLPRVAMLVGIPEKDATTISGLSTSVIAGRLQLSGGSIILGQQLAETLAIIVGDTIEVVSPIGLEKILTEPVMPKSKRVVVRGIFAANNKEYDAMNAYTDIETARELFEVPAGGATSVDIRLKNIDQSIPVQRLLTSKLDSSKYKVNSWYDLHTDLYSIMEMERWVAYIILFLIVAVACFNIFSSLTLTVFEKQKDIALLRALGASEKSVLKLFLFQGTLVGLVGTLAGCLIGLAVVWSQDVYGWYELAAQAYIVSALPVDLRASDFALVALGSIGLATVGALIPARRAARIKPAQSLRYE